SRPASAHSVVDKEADHLPFGPAAVVAVGPSKKSAVAAMLGLQQSNVGVGQDSGARFRQQANERVILRVDDQGGHSDLVYNSGSGGAVVVIIGAGKAAIGRSDHVVKFADGTRPARRHLVAFWEQISLAPQAPHQADQEFVFVDAIQRLMHGIGGGSQIG